MVSDAKECKKLMFCQKTKKDLYAGNNILQKIREFFLKIVGITNILDTKLNVISQHII